MNWTSTFRELVQEEAYKYIAIDEANRIQHGKRKEMIRKECYRRARAILKTELNSATKMEVINTLSMPFVQYSFNITKWTLQDLRRIDTKIRKLLTCYKMHHPKANKDRLYLPRSEWGRCLIQTELTYKTTTIGLHKYLQTTKHWMMKLVRKHENSKKLYSIAKESRKYMRELNIEIQELNQDLAPAKAAKAMKQKAKSEGLKNLKPTWKEKPLHGRDPLRATNNADLDQKKTHQ